VRDHLLHQPLHDGGVLLVVLADLGEDVAHQPLVALGEFVALQPAGQQRVEFHHSLQVEFVQHLLVLQAVLQQDQHLLRARGVVQKGLQTIF